MSKKDLFDLTKRPYTQLKLKILQDYLNNCWAPIIFKKAKDNPSWHKWQKIYYIDCFAGRGKYNKDGQQDVIDGSPLVALKCALEFQSKYKGISMNCIFIDRDKIYCDELKKFCEPYKEKIKFIVYNNDFNEKIIDILTEINYHPAFFFIDPEGIKGLKKESVEKIVNRNGATDILLNYIKSGVERIVGLAKKDITDIVDSGNLEKYVKTLECLADFRGLDIFDKLNLTERERLKDWTEAILKSGKLENVAVFDMPYLHKSDNIYYLLFASREPLAKKIMLSIFKDAKKTNYYGQPRLPIFNEREFEL